MNRNPLSVVVITFNEEKNIERCLNSVMDLADEIVIVDSFSSDQTEAICKKFPQVRFIQHPFEGHIQQKNFALDQASHTWVLSLDADEALSPELHASISEVLEAPDADAFRFNRLSNYCGSWIRHGSWYPDTKMRLFNRHKVRWQGINPHDKAMLTEHGLVRHIKGDLLHYTYYSIQEHIAKLDYFSSLAAKAYYQRRRRATLFNVVINPLFAFVRDYLFRQGFLDGYYGYVIARLTAFYTFQKYIKLRAMQEASPYHNPIK